MLPSKIGGVIAMFGALLILLLLPFHLLANIRSNRYRPVFQLLFWLFVFNFLFLLWVGARPIAEPYILLGQLSTLIYFVFFGLLFLFLPLFTFSFCLFHVSAHQHLAVYWIGIDMEFG